MRVVELKKVCFLREGRQILDGIDWCVEEGEHWALLGANGSGKTTLLKILTGYEWATSGSVTVWGNVYGACDIRELRRHIGWVSASLEQRLPVGDTALEVAASGLDASIGLYHELSPEEWERGREALARLGMAHMETHRFGTMSQGEQQRVLIARALIAKPRLLVLDEPCAGLDPGSRAAFLADLEAFSKQNDAPSIVLVTHHIEEIGPWVNRVLVLREGRCLAAGKPEEVLTAPIMREAFGLECRVERDEDNFKLSHK